MRHTLVLWLCLIVGCINHEAERADNLTKAAGHQIALELCLNKAIETNQAGLGELAYAEYTACANAADKMFR